MTELKVIAVENGRGWKQFIELPYRLYRNNPYWVPPLRIAQKELFDIRKHPFYEHAEIQGFLACRGSEIVGRIAAIHDRNFNAFQNDQVGLFGFFESVNEQPVADALLGAARKWLLDRGARVIRGPVNPSTNYECGLLVDGFDSSPQVMMTYNPPYYGELLENAGLRKAKDIWALHAPTMNDGASWDRVLRIADRALARNNIRIRPIRMKAFKEDVELVWKVYNSAWSRNWGFVPMTRDEFFFTARDMKTILDPNLVLLGEVDGKVVGFSLGLPDINRALKHAAGRLFPLGLLKILYHKQSIRSFRAIALGIMEQFRTAGVAAGFYAELIRHANRLGYQDCEMSWVLEDNVLMIRSIEVLGGKRYKTYRIYEWD